MAVLTPRARGTSTVAEGGDTRPQKRVGGRSAHTRPAVSPRCCGETQTSSWFREGHAPAKIQHICPGEDPFPAPRPEIKSGECCPRRAGCQSQTPPLSSACSLCLHCRIHLGCSKSKKYAENCSIETHPSQRALLILAMTATSASNRSFELSLFLFSE